MKKSFMTRVLAVSLSAAMAFSMSSASNLMTASAASTVNLKTTFKTLKVNQKYQLTLKNNTLGWKITKVTTSNKKICTVYGKKASSVMLKGKGVGRAKIQVKVKTTKRKYPKNIKIMTCTANVKAADTDTPVVDALTATATALSKGQVRVQFNKAVDDASDASAFKVSGGVTVTKSEQAADKKSTVLTLDGAESGKTYDLTVSGMKVNGEAQADLKLSFTTPTVDEVVTGYELKVTADPQIVKCDGQHQARVTFELLTKDGKAVTDKNVQIQFSASIGTFADSRVTLDGGKATVQYNAPQLNTGTTAGIQATVVEADNKEMIGTVGTGSITLSPNPDSLVSEAAILTSAAAGTADRVIAYFDKNVSADDFMTKGRPDFSKFSCTITSQIANSFTSDTPGTNHEVIAILPVAGEQNALEFLVNTPMTDNSNVRMTFKDKRKSSNTIDTTNTVYFRLADAREPSALNVESTGTKTIKITFSEAVSPAGPAKNNGTYPAFTGNERYSAWNIDNYLIDGRSLSDWGITQDNSYRDGETASSSTGDIDSISTKDVVDEEFDARDGKVVLKAYSVNSEGVGTDNRAVVEITVGSGHPLAAGTHHLTVRNVGDWASASDGARNSVSTQVFPFEVTDSADKPSFKVTVQSPEQFELECNTDFKIAERGDRFTTANSADNSVTNGGASVLKLQEYVNGTWTDITTGSNQGQNPIRVTKVKDSKKYLVEVMKDWSVVYDQESTRTSYYGKQLRLHVDAGKLVNVNNNLRNDAIDINLNADDANVTDGQKMKEQDVTSPTIVGVTRATSNNQPVESWNVELSEPVKISAAANKEGLTPSQRQSAGVTQATENQGVPVPYAEFISVDNPSVRIEGIINDNKFIDAYDKVINVKPERSLSGGDWRLVVGSISDDYGTVLATAEHTITVDAVTTSTDFQIVWAAVANADDYETAQIGNIGTTNQGGYVFVKFNKPVDQAAALNTNNYTLNNATLPHGSYIHANINGYDNHDNLVDSVTIVLPNGSGNIYQNYTVDSRHSVLSVTGITSSTGEALSNGGMNTMPFNFAANGNDVKTGDDAEIATIGTKYDAVWGNDASETFDGVNIKSIKAYFEALRAALDDPKYRKVKITQDIFAGADDSDTMKAAKEVFGNDRIVRVNRAVNIDMTGITINGNVEVNTSDVVGKMTIKGGTINGSVGSRVGLNNATLIVNAASVKHFILDGVTVDKGDNKDNNNDKRDSAIRINNVWADSFKLTGGATVVGDIFVNDTDGFGMDIDKTSVVDWDTDYRLFINSNGVVNLKGDFSGRRVIVKQAATVNLGIPTVNSKGEITGIAESIDLEGATVSAEGADAFIKLTRATLVDANNGNNLQIIAAAKNVKVYVEDGQNQLAGGANSVVNYRTEKGGNIIAVDENGRTLTDTSKTQVESSNINKDADTTPSSVQHVFQNIDVLAGVDSGDTSLDETANENGNRRGKYTYNFAYDEVVVSGSSFVLKDAASLESEIMSSIGAHSIRKADGTEIRNSDIKVTFGLSSGAKIFTRNSTTGKIELAANAAELKGTETITVTFKYEDYTFTKSIKITKA